MIALGPFRFGLDGLAFQEMARTSGYAWPEVPVVGGGPQLQFTGREADTIRLPGVFFPHWRGGLSQLPAMRLAAEQGLPLPVVTGYGFFLGLWVIESIEETQGLFFRDGAPRRVDFVISLKQYASPTDLLKLALPAVIGAIRKLF